MTRVKADILRSFHLLIFVVFGAVVGRHAYAGAPDADGTIHLPEMSIPESSFLSAESRSALRTAREARNSEATSGSPCEPIETATPAQAPSIRKCEANEFYHTYAYKQLRNRYRVNVTSREIGGVLTEVFTPLEGISKRNRFRILLNLHGGGFLYGSRWISHLESIPIASVGKITVLSVDYRMAPDHLFPAATEDVAAVYRQLLKTYKPRNIGIYGCSAGGLLVAESIVYLKQQNIPLPGAIGMFCEGAAYWTEGDSGYMGKALSPPDVTMRSSSENPYFRHISPNDALAFPARSPSLLAGFPPTLLLSATRDFALSSVAYTHAILVNQGVDVEIRIWDGLEHAFQFDPDVPESREAYAVTTHFFDRHLGTGLPK